MTRPHPIRLSVNVNKVATLRNSRGGAVPDVVEAARVCVAAGAGGITVHPRADERHIRPDDVRALKAAFADRWGPALEFNIEGDPRPDWLDLVCEVRPQQATLVPVQPGEITSHMGWSPRSDAALVEEAVARLKQAGCRVSLFVDPDPSAIEWCAKRGADRVELYTEPYARAFARGGTEAQQSFERYAQAACFAHSLGLGVNAGHDLDRDNLRLFRRLPHLAEVSIGHALISDALFLGLEATVRAYLAALHEEGTG